MSDEDKALVPIRDAFSDAFNPQNMTEAGKMSDWLAKSTLIPDTLRGKPGDVMVILITGRELGLSTMQSLRSLNVIKGKVVMAAELMVAQVVSHGDICEYFRLVESNNEIATYETKRAGSPEPTKMSYSMRDAALAGLAEKHNWKSHPAAMLRARCSGALARAMYPDLVAGIYVPDEGEEISQGVRPLVKAEIQAAAMPLTKDAEVVKEIPPSRESDETFQMQYKMKPGTMKPPWNGIHPSTPTRKAAPPTGQGFGTEKQIKRIYGIASGTAKAIKRKGITATFIVDDCLAVLGLESANDIPDKEAYDIICDAAKDWRPPENPKNIPEAEPPPPTDAELGYDQDKGPF